MTPLAILKADPSHLRPAFDLLAETKDHLCSVGIPQWDDHYPTIDVVQGDIDRGSLFITMIAGQVVGAVSIDSHQEPEYRQVSWQYPEPSLVVHRLCVSPAHQGRGIGTALMDFVEVHASRRGCSSIRLDVFSGNPNAMALYEHRGYRRVGQVLFPWRDQPFHCMEKPFPQPGSAGSDAVKPGRPAR